MFYLEMRRFYVRLHQKLPLEGLTTNYQILNVELS